MARKIIRLAARKARNFFLMRTKHSTTIIATMNAGTNIIAMLMSKQSKISLGSLNIFTFFPERDPLSNNCVFLCLLERCPYQDVPFQPQIVYNPVLSCNLLFIEFLEPA